jgi:tRNA dimethylallyltransferase
VSGGPHPESAAPVQPVLAIVGPTGVGKTAVAAALAREWPVEVVSMDSRQVYRRMDIGTGKPTLAERRAVRHHLVDVADPDERYDAARFAREARAAIADIRARGRWPVLVGGTGLYFRALVRGLSPLPPADPALRRRLRAEVAARGAPALHARLRDLDPAAAARIHPRDVVRVVRAIEVVSLTGDCLGTVHGRAVPAPAPAGGVLAVGLTMARESLYRRLDRRADRMLADGLLEEVRGLLASGIAAELPSMQGIGYRHLVAVVRGAMAIDEATARMKRDTRRYAKRQWTWFARESIAEWVTMTGEDLGTAVAAIEKILERTKVLG